jgi:hypothetical protein
MKQFTYPRTCFLQSLGQVVRLSGLEVVQQDVQTLGFLTVVLDNDTGAADNLSGVTLSVDLGQTGPGTQDLGVGDLDEVDVVLGAQGFNQLDVFG